MNVCFNEKTYEVLNVDFLEDDGELLGQKCRLLYFLVLKEEKKQLITLRLNYPPRDYRKTVTEQTAKAIDAAFHHQMELFIKINREETLNIDEELATLPSNIKKRFKTAIGGFKESKPAI